MIELKNGTRDPIKVPGPANLTLLPGQCLTVNQNCVDLRRARSMRGLGIRDLQDGQSRPPSVESAAVTDHADPDSHPSVETSPPEEPSPEESPVGEETEAATLEADAEPEAPVSEPEAVPPAPPAGSKRKRK